jgi:hypothetical protein
MVIESKIGLTSLISTLAFYDERFPSYIILLNSFLLFSKKRIDIFTIVVRELIFLLKRLYVICAVASQSTRSSLFFSTINC